MGTQSTTPLDRFMSRVMTLQDLLDSADEEIGWFWDRLFPQDGVTLIANGGGKGKTVFAFRLAVAAAAGKKFLDQAVTPSRVVFVTEAPPVQLRKLGRLSEFDRTRLTLSLDTTGCAWTHLESLVREKQPDLLVIDTLTTIAPQLGLHGSGDFDWFSATHTTAVLSRLRDLQYQYGLKHVLLLAHVRKGRKGQRNRITLEDVRGSGGIVEQCDGVWGLTPSEDGKPGAIYRLKDRTMGETMTEVEFLYDEVTTQLTRFGEMELTEENILTLVSGEYTFIEAIAEKLKRRKSEVTKVVKNMLATGMLVRDDRSKALSVPSTSES